jgi:hypothetical protein
MNKTLFSEEKKMAELFARWSESSATSRVIVFMLVIPWALEQG